MGPAMGCRVVEQVLNDRTCGLLTQNGNQSADGRGVFVEEPRAFLELITGRRVFALGDAARGSGRTP